jgi:hypothetical protein
VRRKARVPETETATAIAVAQSSTNSANGTTEEKNFALNGNGKRKAFEALDIGEEQEADESAKKVRVEDAGEGEE